MQGAAENVLEEKDYGEKREILDQKSTCVVRKNKVKLGTDIDMKVMATFLNRMVIYYEKRI